MTVTKPDLPPLTSGMQVSPSHLILNVADTDATIRFYRGIFGAGVERDMEIESPALDAMFGRKGVRIRSTFIDVGGYRLHTIESLDVAAHVTAGEHGTHRTVVRRARPRSGPPTRHRRRLRSPRRATTSTSATQRFNAKMFFIADPDGVGCELVEYPK